MATVKKAWERKRLNLALSLDDYSRLCELQHVLECRTVTEAIRILINLQYIAEQQAVRALGKVRSKRQFELPLKAPRKTRSKR